MTDQTIGYILWATLDSRIRRLLDAYPVIYLACHRDHVRESEKGNVVTEHQASVLNHLDATRPKTVSKLAEHMGVSRSTMSITVRRLANHGFIVRTADKNDARRVGLTLSPSGMRVKEHNTVLDSDLTKELFRLMPGRELNMALEGLECLARYAKILLQRRKRGRD